MWASERGGERRPLRWWLRAGRRRRGTLTCGPDCGAMASEVVPPLASGAVSWFPTSWVFYSRAEQRPPRWLSPRPAPSHKPHLLCCYSWSISQLPFDCIWLHVEEYWCVWGQRCFLKGYSQTRPRTSCNGDTEGFFFLLKIHNYLLHIFPSNDLQIPFLLGQKCKKR